jgi:hypothetical protein
VRGALQVTVKSKAAEFDAFYVCVKHFGIISSNQITKWKVEAALFEMQVRERPTYMTTMHSTKTMPKHTQRDSDPSLSDAAKLHASRRPRAGLNRDKPA